MSNLTAYILAVDSIAERVDNAQCLAQALADYDGLSKIEIVPAIYWQEINAATEFLKQNPEIGFTHRYLTVCNKGQLCATLSHIKLWKKLLASPHDGVLVFEDDIYISDPPLFQQILEALPSNPDLEFLRIHLHKSFREEILAIESAQIFVDDPSDWGFANYYLSRQGAAKLLQRFQQVDDNVDLIIPRMNKAGELRCKTVRQVAVEHHAFDGMAEDLPRRHAKELRHHKLQRAASTIWSSPLVYDDAALYAELTGLVDINVRQLREHGHTTLKAAVDKAEVKNCRDQILNNLALFRRTRPATSALHLAGFHRFSKLEPLHTQLAGNPVVHRLLEHLRGSTAVQSLGLSDITINRSQCWHKDLLRGKFSSYLEDQEMIWGDNGGGVYKILFYLQAGSSLKVIRGSHKIPIPLDSDRSSEPDENDLVESIPVEVGDIVVMDIRMSHCGASEEVYASGKYDNDPRMLISTALGFSDQPLTRAMEKGNFHRLIDWLERNP
ncbi:MAG: glycosyltransferase family 25 protein [Xanthomonadales bacterium]|nr:glycosyltransferase family 25 protein [Xanthomonadales bacterium]